MKSQTKGSVQTYALYATLARHNPGLSLDRGKALVRPYTTLPDTKTIQSYFIYAIGHSSLYALIHIEALLPRVALNIFSSLINSVVVDEKCSRFVDESFMIWQIPVYQPVSFRFRSSLRRRSRTSRRCSSTRT